MKNFKKFRLFSCFFLIGLIMVFAAPASIGADQKTKQGKIDCTYAVEKGKDGKEAYKLQGKDCKSFVAQMKPRTKTKGRGIGVDCEGACRCTLDTADVLVCRGCCSEFFSLARR